MTPDEHEHSYGRYRDSFLYYYFKCSCGSTLLGDLKGNILKTKEE